MRRTVTGHTGTVHAVAISPDGQWLATAGNDGTARIWDRTDSRTIALLRLDGPLHACAWTPDGRGITVGGAHGLGLYAFRPGAPGW
ncbi:WD40 repeat domain-containing protein [Kitasatospora sp. NBC_00315]|uniref:WD40 repeat domain-containing protein n=1 Tax=Kitasatospora sp. NBC_00315 TaxID=2975963 RepID=UPI0032526AF1